VEETVDLASYVLLPCDENVCQNAKDFKLLS